MPITEVIRVLATAAGTREGEAVTVRLAYDVDGTFGADEAAFGYPAFWLRIDGETVAGPFAHEGDAIDAAAERFGAAFG
jgi:hypothetical protein